MAYDPDAIPYTPNPNWHDLAAGGTALSSTDLLQSNRTVVDWVKAEFGGFEAYLNAQGQVGAQIATGSTPSASAGPGLGSLGAGAAVSINGTDSSGRVSFTPGRDADGTGDLVLVTFVAPPAPGTAQPRAHLSPGNAAAAVLDAFTTESSLSWTIGLASVPPTGLVDRVAFNYDVIWTQ